VQHSAKGSTADEVSGRHRYFDTELLITYPSSGLFTDAGGPSSEGSINCQVFAGVSARVRN
jgi:hypothetical protein